MPIREECLPKGPVSMGKGFYFKGVGGIFFTTETQRTQRFHRDFE